MEEEKVSVIIPCYNFGDYIEECVTSINNQTYSNVEIIVVNDGSTDGTKEILERLRQTYSKIKVINKNNEGVSSARNDGLNAATGKYVMFVDGDDYLAPDCVSYMKSLIEERKSQFALSKNCFTSKSDLQVSADNKEFLNSDEATALLLSPRVIVGSWNKIYSREFLLKNNIKFEADLFYGEGLRFITTVAQLASNIAVGERKVYYYRRNNYNSATAKFNIDKLYNGLLAITRIKDNLICQSTDVKEMLTWHETQFHMGIIVRVTAAGKKKEYRDFYNNSVTSLRKNTPHILKNGKISLYKRLLLLGTVCSPSIMAMLDKKRRKVIANNSVG